MKLKLGPNDLVTVQPWDCEGIESPWGWFPDDPPPFRDEQLRKKMKKFKKIKLSAGSTGIVIREGVQCSDDFDEHYEVLIEAKALSVPVRFLHCID